jgi:hypothetical protein
MSNRNSDVRFASVNPNEHPSNNTCSKLLEQLEEIELEVAKTALLLRRRISKLREKINQEHD